MLKKTYASHILVDNWYLLEWVWENFLQYPLMLVHQTVFNVTLKRMNISIIYELQSWTPVQLVIFDEYFFFKKKSERTKISLKYN